MFKQQIEDTKTFDVNSQRRIQNELSEEELLLAKQTYYNANEIIEELSDESNFIETPHKNWHFRTKYSRLLKNLK